MEGDEEEALSPRGGGGRLASADVKPSTRVEGKHNIVDLAAGEAHTIVLTGSAHVFSWGRGVFGRLGLGTDDDKNTPIPVVLFKRRGDAGHLATDIAKYAKEVDHAVDSALNVASTVETRQIKLSLNDASMVETQQKVVGIAAGAYHSLALTDDGSVWSWGYNAYCQLGRDGKPTSEPARVSFTDDWNITKDGQGGEGASLGLVREESGGAHLCEGVISEGAGLWHREEAQIGHDDEHRHHVGNTCSALKAGEPSNPGDDRSSDSNEKSGMTFPGREVRCSSIDTLCGSLGSEVVQLDGDRIQKDISEHSPLNTSRRLNGHASISQGGDDKIEGEPHVRDGSETSSQSLTDPGKTNWNIVNIKMIAAGGFMSCAVDECGALWVWGNCPSSSDGQEGSISESGGLCMMVRERPTRLYFFSQQAVIKVSCGQEHVLMLVAQSVSVSEGENPSAKTGDGNVSCSVGAKHDTSRRFEGCSLYAWGGNKHGQLGVGDTKSRAFPVLLSRLVDKSVGPVQTFACGGYHSVVVTCRGRQGVTLQPVPRPCEFSGNRSVDFSPGMEAADDSCSRGHELEMSRERAGDTCWSFGLGENGQLGHGTTLSTPLPTPVRRLDHVEGCITAVGCGLFHSCVVVQGTEVWVWGMEAGMGLCPGTGAGDFLEPVQIPDGLFHFEEVMKGQIMRVVCGAAHTVIAKKGQGRNLGDELWAWGRGLNGVIGNGRYEDCYCPCPVAWPPPFDVVEASESPPSSAKDVRKETQKPGMVATGQSGDPAVGVLVSENAALKTKVRELQKEMGTLYAGVYGETPGNFSVQLSEWMQKVRTVSDNELDRLVEFYREMLRLAEDETLCRRVKRWMEEFMRSAERPCQSLQQSPANGLSEGTGGTSEAHPLDRLSAHVMEQIKGREDAKDKEPKYLEGNLTGLSWGSRVLPVPSGSGVVNVFSPHVLDTIRGSMMIKRSTNPGAKNDAGGHGYSLSADEKESLSRKMRELHRL